MTRDDADRFQAGFADPPAAEYGNVPFWWWDGDELSAARITDQLERLAERGVEAVCFEQKYPHGPPEGPQVPYFSEEWWEYMEHTVAECDRLGMNLWIHDLTYHHSPPAWKRYWQTRAEEATDDVPELQGHVLDRVTADVAAGGTATLDLPAEFTPFSVAAYPRTDGALDLDDGVDLAVVDGAVTWTAPEADGEDPAAPEVDSQDPVAPEVDSQDPAAAVDADEWHVAAVGYRPEGLRRTSPDLIEWIIENHYEEYERRVGEAFGDALVGTFQDELFQLQGSIPCDGALLDRYRAEWGEDLADRAVALYEDCGPGTAAVRARFWDVVVTALEENWFRPLYEWHDRRGLRLAHDNWGRNDLAEHATEYGDYVRTMRWYHEPGYDDGGEFEGVGTRNFFDAKLAASIAANYGRDRVWGELFHTTGWGFPPDLHYAGIAENACYGLDHYNKHGCYYATLGGWYEHAPPDTHFRQPYWEQLDAFNDAVTRLMYACSRGDRVVDAVVLYPITSLHGLRPAGADPEPDVPGGNYLPEFPDLVAEIDERTREIAERFYDDVADLLFVDHETVRDGSVADGQFRFAGGTADGTTEFGPRRDLTAYAGGNALIAEALLTLAAYTDDETAREYATRVLEELEAEYVASDGTVAHVNSGDPRLLLEDHARVVAAFTRARQVLGPNALATERAPTEVAQVVADRATDELQEPDGAFRDGPEEGVGLLDEPLRPLDGGVEMAEALLDLSAVLAAERTDSRSEDDANPTRYVDAAHAGIAAFAGAWDRIGIQVAGYGSVAARLTRSDLVVTVGGSAGSDLHRAALRVADHEAVVVPDAPDVADGVAVASRGDERREATTPDELMASVAALTSGE